MSIPTQCHLWQAGELTSNDLHEALALVEEFMDEPHRGRYLRQCKRCGQLYFHEFSESIDWVDGEDPQYQIYLPVDSREEVDLLLTSDEFRSHSFSPRLMSDFPKEARTPRVYWMR
jgi:hypothetical protein